MVIMAAPDTISLPVAEPAPTERDPGSARRDDDAVDPGFILHVDSCITPFETINDACILCRGGQIVAVGGASAFTGLEDVPRLERPGCRAVPGLIDTHIHGSGGIDLMVMDQEPDLSAMSRTLAAHGVTSFLPTVLATTPERMQAILNVLSQFVGDGHPGAVPVGINLEGPFLNRQKRGTQSQEAIRPIDLALARDLLAAGGGTVRIMTFAPELERAEALIQLLREQQVVASMGHSLADETAARRAVDAGATRCTHFYNGMPQLGHRDVSLTTVALTDDRVTIELIADGIHIHPRMIDLACRAKPRARVIGISDASTGAGLADGQYRVGGDVVEIREGSCRRVSDGRLAGTCFTLDQALSNFRRFCLSLPEQDAVASYSLYAAQSVGLQDRGILQPGKRADIAVFDAQAVVVLTIVHGRVVYDREQAAPAPAASA